MSSFHVEVVTPAGGVVLDRQARHLRLPGEAGSFGLLAGHADLMASLGAGIAELEDDSGKVTPFTICGGFVQVKDGHASVLAESAELADKIDLARAEAARDRAQKRIAAHEAGMDLDRAELALARAINRIRLAGKSH